MFQFYNLELLYDKFYKFWQQPWLTFLITYKQRICFTGFYIFGCEGSAVFTEMVLYHHFANHIDKVDPAVYSSVFTFL